MGENRRTIRQIQQEFANNCGFERRIIWDLCSAAQADLFKEKIKQLIPLPPENEEKNKGKIKAVNESRRILFESVWAQRKYSNWNSLTALIYVLVTKERDFNLAPNSTEFSCHPVFRARKCYTDNGDSETCCMIFIDETGRVYQRWEDFVETNALPECTMVAPKRGLYMIDPISGQVELDVYATPAASLMAKTLAIADTSLAVGGVLSAGVSIAAVATLPVWAPLMSAAAGVGLVAAGYGSLRSTGNLIDRKKHEQSISLSDRQARNSWIGMAAGAVGLGATSATRAVQAAATTGRNVTLLTEVVVNGMNISSIVLSGTGLANGVLDLVLRYQDDEKFSKLELLQLSSSLFLFTHSVYNFRLASQIISDTQNGTIEAYRRDLSRRQRRAFNKMAKETLRLQGEARGKMDIIRSVNEIPSKQYLNDMFKINKQLNEKMIRPSFRGAGDGGGEQILLNGEVAVNAQDLRANLQHGQGADILGQVKQPIPPSFGNGGGGGGSVGTATSAAVAGAAAQRPLFKNSAAAAAGNLNEEIAAENAANPLAEGVNILRLASIFLPSGIEIHLMDFGMAVFQRVANAESFENVVEVLANYFYDLPESLRYLMRLTRRFIEHLLGKIEEILKIFISTESVLFHIGVHVMKKYGRQSAEFLIAMEDEIVEAVREWLMSFNTNANENLQQRCELCKHFYAISKAETEPLANN